MKECVCVKAAAALLAAAILTPTAVGLLHRCVIAVVEEICALVLQTDSDDDTFAQAGEQR